VDPALEGTEAHTLAAEHEALAQSGERHEIVVLGRQSSSAGRSPLDDRDAVAADGVLETNLIPYVLRHAVLAERRDVTDGAARRDWLQPGAA